MDEGLASDACRLLGALPVMAYQADARQITTDDLWIGFIA
jgi:hypothetical protein